MNWRARKRAAAASLTIAVSIASWSSAAAQSCPEPVASARRLVLVTADGLSTSTAKVRLYERPTADAGWRPAGPVMPAIVGRNGMAWAFPFRALAAPTEPVKTEGDKRAPAGFFRLTGSLGQVASDRPGYVHLEPGTVCVDDPASPAYNTITTRAKVGWRVSGENMWRIPHYRHGLLVDYPTSRTRRGGSCIFIHLRMPGASSTSGCVALEEPALLAIEQFAASGAVLAILPAQARRRLGACLPVN